MSALQCGVTGDVRGVEALVLCIRAGRVLKEEGLGLQLMRARGKLVYGLGNTMDRVWLATLLLTAALVCGFRAPFAVAQSGGK